MARQTFFFSELFLECPAVTSILLKTNLRQVRAPIRSLSIYDFDRTVTTLTIDLFASASSSNDLQIKQLQFSNSNIQVLKDNSLINLKESLESLSIVNGKLTKVSIRFTALFWQFSWELQNLKFIPSKMSAFREKLSPAKRSSVTSSSSRTWLL